jgi:hypothetical protein
MDVNPTEKKPTWWFLYTLGVVLVGSIGVVEPSVTSGAVRLALEVAAVVAVSVSMLAWLRVNRARIELAEAPRTPGTLSALIVAASRPARHKNRVKIAAAWRRVG